MVHINNSTRFKMLPNRKMFVNNKHLFIEAFFPYSIRLCKSL